MVAARRCPTIRDNVVKNRFFSKDTGTSRPPFKACKSLRCLTCPIYKSSGSVMINSVFNISVVNHNQNTKYLKNSNPKYFIGSCLKK